LGLLTLATRGFMMIQQRNEREKFMRVIIHAVLELSKVKIMNNHYYIHACGAGVGWGGLQFISNGLRQDEYFHNL
jgi:hypothetical protein